MCLIFYVNVQRMNRGTKLYNIRNRTMYEDVLFDLESYTTHKFVRCTSSYKINTRSETRKLEILKIVCGPK